MAKFILQQKVHNLAQLRDFAQKLAAGLGSRAVVLLQGSMAAGKSEFVRQLLQNYGHKLTVASPTFALQQNFEFHNTYIAHWDLYRLRSEEDLESSGFWDQFAMAPAVGRSSSPSSSVEKHWIFVEWPEKLQQEFLPRDWPCWLLEIEVSDGARELTLTSLW